MALSKQAAALVVFLNIQLLVMLKTMGDQPVQVLQVLPVVLSQQLLSKSAFECYRSVSLVLSSGISK